MMHAWVRLILVVKSCLLASGCSDSPMPAPGSLALSSQLDFGYTNALAGILKAMNEDMVDLKAMMSLKDGSVCTGTGPST